MLAVFAFGLTAAACTQPAPSVDPGMSTSVGRSETSTSVNLARGLETDREEFADALGTASRACVDVDQLVAEVVQGTLNPANAPVVDVRSGDFVAGNFAVVVGRWESFEDGGVAKIYWIPADISVARSEVLEVEIEPLDPAGTTQIMSFGGGGNYSWVESGAFWPSGTSFPHPGRYRLTARAPGHWGCFELTV